MPGGISPQAADGRDAPPMEAEPFPVEDWLEILRFVAQHYRLSASVQSARLAADANAGGDEDASIRTIAGKMGLRVKHLEPGRHAISNWHLPAILKLKGQKLALVRAISKDGEASVSLSGEQGLERPCRLDELLAETQSIVLARPARTVADARVDDYIKSQPDGWLRRIVFRDPGAFAHVMVASLIANTLGLTGIIFSMQVYDRVVPAQSFSTLYVLFSGVVLALSFDFLMRRARTGIIDLLGKSADLRISDMVFGHALRIRSRARPGSTGSFVAQLRDLEHVRDVLTSTAVAALADLPFFLFFIAVLWWIGGELALVPLCALVAVVLPGILLQRRLRTHANESMRESSLRNAMLVEAVQGIEDIKCLQAEDRFQHQWNHYNAVTGEAQIKLRALSNGLSTWTQVVQTGVYALTVFVGAPMVIAGDITTGTLVGASILGSRMMGPMGQLSQIAGRLQQARIAKNGLDRLIRMPVDHPDSESRIHCPRIEGDFRLKDAVFSYGDTAAPVALMVRDLKIKPGERIAVLGRNGAGKSTLLLALSGLLDASAGQVLLDDLSLPQIDPADLRRDIGLLTQNSRLFFGTLRDNLLMGAANASDAEIQQALAMTGADDFVRRLPKGLEHVVQEGGAGLSGGQKQSILLARLLIRQPRTILLDEPTASMDETTERHFIARFSEWSKGRTVVIATHRMRVLELADRLLVVENGSVVLDDTKERALQTLLGMSTVEQPNIAGRPAGTDHDRGE